MTILQERNTVVPHNNLTLKKISNAVLANPITRWGRDNYLQVASDELKILDNDDQIIHFLNDENGGYTVPCFLDEEYIKQQGKLKDDDDDSISCYFRTYKTEKEYSKMKGDYEKFKSYFLRDNWMERRLFTFTGTAGSGKTTLANKLISQKTNNFICKRHDFETNITECTLFINRQFPKNIYKSSGILSYMLILIKEIGSTLHKEFTGNFTKGYANKMIHRVRDICMVYNEYFDNPNNTVVEFKRNFEDFFKILLKFNNVINTESDAVINDAENLVLSLQEYFEKIFEDTFSGSFEMSKEKQKDILNNINKLLFILFVLYYCLSKTDEYKGSQFLLFIDNIEHAIIDNDDRRKLNILMSDVSMIFKSVLSALKDSSNYIKSMLNTLPKTPETSPASGVLLTMRDTTDGFFQEIKKSIHVEEHQYANIDITPYFNAESIFKKKLRYFFNIDIDDVENWSNIPEEDVKEILTAYRNIVSDKSKSKWCLSGFIHEFYNHHHRNIVKNTIDLFSNKIKETEVFNKHWKRISEANKEERDSEAFWNYKHIVRLFFIRLLLEHVNTSRDGAEAIFEQLKKQPHFYTRRVLTYLHNHSLSSNEFINTNSLIEQILLKPSIKDISYSNIDEDDIRYLAQALFIMNSTNADTTSWTSLIYIEVPGGNVFGQDDLFDFIKNNWEEYKNNNKNLPVDFSHVTMKITYAGKLYVWFMAEFEYFTCRYAKDYPAIFMAETIKELKLIINNITAVTLKDDEINGKLPCIANHLETETEFLAKNDGFYSPPWLYKDAPDDRGMVHPKRILTRHIVYIKKLSKYFNSKYSDSKIKDKNGLIGFLDRIRENYEARLSQLEKDYKKYMELS
ncbi:MAG: hypothetical protein FWD47_12330 [Treponema sp.]|nr:hypothetical protein [Treponema sp.]